MAHNLEIVDGKVQHVYVGDVPWHGLGKKVHHDLTPEQMMKEAGLDWEVRKFSMTSKVGGKTITIPDRKALVRVSDDPSKNGTVLSVVGSGWNPVQNAEAFSFFHEWIMAGGMQMHTAGSLQGGQIVWALAKVNEEFTVFGKDRVESFLLFSNFHQYGKASDVRFTGIRVVCNNTLDMALLGNKDAAVRIDHRSKFDPQKVKDALNYNVAKMHEFKEAAEFLGSRKAPADMVDDFYRTIAPATTEAKRKAGEFSRVATLMKDALEKQPGAEFAAGTWWPVYNSVTYAVDHMVGDQKNPDLLDSRLTSNWYGQGRQVKAKALALATEFAKAA